MTTALMIDSPAGTMPVRRRSWSDKEALATLRLAHRQLKRPLNLGLMEEWSARSGIPVPSQRTYTVRFGSWVQACEAAGVPHTNRVGDVRPGPKPVASSTCWAAVRAYLELCEHRGWKATMDRYELLAREHGWPSRNTVILRLGRPWPEVLAQASRHRVKASPHTPPHHRRTGARPATIRQILASINAAAVAHPGRLTTKSYHQWAAARPGAPALDEIRARFGSWAAACKAAGVSSGRPAWTSRSALAKLRDAYRQIGDPFTGYRYKDFVEAHPEGHTYPTVDTAARLFGSWGAVCEKVGTFVARPQWGTEKTAAALNAAARAVGEGLTMQSYRVWAQAENEAGRHRPTVETIARRYGSWRSALAAVGS